MTGGADNGWFPGLTCPEAIRRATEVREAIKRLEAKAKAKAKAKP